MKFRSKMTSSYFNLPIKCTAQDKGLKKLGQENELTWTSSRHDEPELLWSNLTFLPLFFQHLLNRDQSQSTYMYYTRLWEVLQKKGVVTCSQSSCLLTISPNEKMPFEIWKWRNVTVDTWLPLMKALSGQNSDNKIAPQVSFFGHCCTFQRPVVYFHW